MKHKQPNAIKACEWELKWLDGPKGRAHNPDPFKRTTIKLNILARYMSNCFNNTSISAKLITRARSGMIGGQPVAVARFEIPEKHKEKAIEIVGGSQVYQIGEKLYKVCGTVGNIGAMFFLEFTR